MIERLLLALLLVAGIAMSVALARAWLRRRDRRVLERLREGTRETAAQPGSPRLVYFTTKTCVVCRAQQEPAIERLRERLPTLVLERHDAIEESALAREYGVLSVPTTAAYGPDGALVAINRGFTPASVLLAQLEGRDPEMEGGADMPSEEIEAQPATAGDGARRLG